jgi:uncharacterized repeat protein (TIGR03803 family)
MKRPGDSAASAQLHRQQWRPVGQRRDRRRQRRPVRNDADGRSKWRRHRLRTRQERLDLHPQYSGQLQRQQWSRPGGPPLADANGDLFGTTSDGGTNGVGTVFELVKSGSTYTLNTLASFTGSNGAHPTNSLIADANGDLFGTTQGGGANNEGTVFELVKSGSTYTLTTLVSFSGSNGIVPIGGLIADANGDLFGTTYGGGANGQGTVFEITNSGFVVARPPIMLDAIYTPSSNITTLSGTAQANSSVSIFDEGNLIGTVTAAADGTWSLQANVAGSRIHSYTESSTDLAGNIGSSTGVTLYTPAGHKSLQGGSGNDVLIAAPNDTLAGGAGSNMFVFNPSFGKVMVTDFNVSQDVLRFDHTLFANATASQVLSQTHDSKAGAVIVVDANDTVTLTGVTVAQLQSHFSDFQFF